MIAKHRIHKVFRVPHLRCSLFVQSYPGLTAGPISFGPKNFVTAKTMQHEAGRRRSRSTILSAL
jgi:hypothetical protein